MKSIEEFYALSEKYQNDQTSEDRRKHGVHYTSYEDVMKIVKPCIVDDWEERENPSYEEFLRYTVFDPACGCGNFLFVAYTELKKLEKKLFGEDKDRYPLWNLIGIEMDPKAARACFRALITCSGRLTEKPRIFVGDALDFDWNDLYKYRDKLVGW